MQLAIKSREKVLDTFISRCCKDDIPGDIQAAMRVHSVVQVCGYVERSMEVIVLERLRKKAHPKLLEFVKSHFRYGTNFRCTVIKSFLERFDQDWARKFQDFMDANEEAVELVDSAYALRNQAAHGNSVNVGDKRLSDLFDGAKNVVSAVVKATA